MPRKKKVKEQDVLYVLRREDGSVRAKLPMTPSLADTINKSRKRLGFFDGEWKPEASETGVWDLNFMAMPDWMLECLHKAQREPIIKRMED